MNKETILRYRIIIILKVLIQNIISQTKVSGHIYRHVQELFIFIDFIKRGEGMKTVMSIETNDCK